MCMEKRHRERGRHSTVTLLARFLAKACGYGPALRAFTSLREVSLRRTPRISLPSGLRYCGVKKHSFTDDTANPRVYAPYFE